MAAYNLIFTKIFNDELSDALDYISQNFNNPSAVNKILNKLSDKVSLIVDNPMLFPLYHDDELASKGVRYIVISKYLLFYEVNEAKKSVELLHFIYGNRNIQDMF